MTAIEQSTQFQTSADCVTMRPSTLTSHRVQSSMKSLAHRTFGSMVKTQSRAPLMWTAFLSLPRSAEVIDTWVATRPSPTMCLAARSAASFARHASFASRSASRLRRSSASAADRGGSRADASTEIFDDLFSASASSFSSLSSLAASSVAILSQSKRVDRGALGSSSAMSAVGGSIAAMDDDARARERI